MVELIYVLLVIICNYFMYLKIVIIGNIVTLLSVTKAQNQTDIMKLK